ncbi:MAG: hypothetical protein IJW59_04750 [Clostridia bacterium]|nr:hypothetical protein [Clostridia bacterium]
MKIAFIIPVLSEINLTKTFNRISESCPDDDFDVYFAINGKLNSFFTQVRTTFLNESRVKAFLADRPVNEHKLITLGMEMTEDYDATIIYSGKEEPNKDVIKAFISSWKAGNRIVYLKKEYSGFKKIWVKLKRAIYSLGIKMLGIFKDRCAETDIQLLDQDVVKTINQLPAKNRQLRVLDSFVGYPTDVIQIEIDHKMKENKNYDEKIKAYKICGIASLASIFLGIITLALGIVGIVLKWTMPAVLYIVLFCVGILSFVMSFVFATKKALHFRVGLANEIPELNDLRTKLEKYNITAKNSK